MNARQLIAIGEPCATPAETLGRQYTRVHRHGWMGEPYNRCATSTYRYG